MATEDVTAEIHGFSEPGATPTPWGAGLEQIRAADTFWLSTLRPDGAFSSHPCETGAARSQLCVS